MRVLVIFCDGLKRIVDLSGDMADLAQELEKLAEMDVCSLIPQEKASQEILQELLRIEPLLSYGAQMMLNDFLLGLLILYGPFK